MFLNEEQIKEIGFRSVGKNFQLSDKASIYNPGKIIIGDNVRIDDFCILSAGPGGIELGNYVHIACYASLIGQALIRMEDYSGISGRVSVYSSSDNYSGEWMTNPTLPAEVMNTHHEAVHIGKHVVVGNGAVILPGSILNNGCAVYALSLVNNSFPVNSIIAGIPATFRKLRKGNIYEHEKILSKI